YYSAWRFLLDTWLGQHRRGSQSVQLRTAAAPWQERRGFPAGRSLIGAQAACRGAARFHPMLISRLRRACTRLIDARNASRDAAARKAAARDVAQKQVVMQQLAETLQASRGRDRK
ncbi:MAG TPA: hypothetical protein VK741_25080, partial [Acetobacteraceae bacterium]|nr:hypothetical protein [Acetobacteraceae bacterium]